MYYSEQPWLHRPAVRQLLEPGWAALGAELRAERKSPPDALSLSSAAQSGKIPLDEISGLDSSPTDSAEVRALAKFDR